MALNLILRPHSWGGYFLDATGGPVPSWFTDEVWSRRWDTFDEARSWAVRQEGGSAVERACTAAYLSRLGPLDGSYTYEEYYS